MYVVFFPWKIGEENSTVDMMVTNKESRNLLGKTIRVQAFQVRVADSTPSVWNQATDLTAVKEGNIGFELFLIVDSKHPLKYTMTL